jgi:transcriptional regulator with XRE-family HTH domain
MTPEPFGARVRRLRMEARLTQAQVAKRAGASDERLVSNWERGFCHPRIDRLAPLAQALGVSCDVLLTGCEAV